jgi:L-iditol 2-dehydrogenase/propanol-preferring alcohol dehydrogenase
MHGWEIGLNNDNIPLLCVKEEGETYAQIMAWINLGVLKPMDFISGVFDFEHIIDAFKLIEERISGTKKIVIKYY